MSDTNDDSSSSSSSAAAAASPALTPLSPQASASSSQTHESASSSSSTEATAAFIASLSSTLNSDPAQTEAGKLEQQLYEVLQSVLKAHHMAGNPKGKLPYLLQDWEALLGRGFYPFKEIAFARIETKFNNYQKELKRFDKSEQKEEKNPQSGSKKEKDEEKEKAKAKALASFTFAHAGHWTNLMWQRLVRGVWCAATTTAPHCQYSFTPLSFSRQLTIVAHQLYDKGELKYIPCEGSFTAEQEVNYLLHQPVPPTASPFQLTPEDQLMSGNADEIPASLSIEDRKILWVEKTEIDRLITAYLPQIDTAAARKAEGKALSQQKQKKHIVLHDEIIKLIENMRALQLSMVPPPSKSDPVRALVVPTFTHLWNHFDFDHRTV